MENNPDQKAARKPWLTGIRVLDLSMGWAGPMSTRQLADNGAEVIKVESCQRFDWWRGWEATQQFIDDNGAEKAASFNTMNRNKRGITLDLANEKGKALFLRLVALCDVLVENYSGGVLPKLGLQYEVLKAVKPDLIMMSMPAFGAVGPWREYRAYGSTVEHASGLPHLNGEADWLPTMHHVAYGDPIAGLNAAAALLIALRHKKRTGQGQFLDLSQAECLFPLAVHGILEQSASGVAPPRLGNRSREFAPHGVYPCRGDDRWVSLQVFDEAQWQRLKSLVGASLAEFGEVEDRRERQSALDAAIVNWTRNQDADAVMLKLQSLNIAAAVVRSAAELPADQQLMARGFWSYRHRDHVGVKPQPAAPYRSDAHAYGIERVAPTLGQHNDEVLRTLLGLSDNDLAQLRAERIIGDKPVLSGAEG